MAQITSLLITRKNEIYWQLLGSDSVEPRSESLFGGSQDGDYITIKSYNGAIVYHRVYFGVIEYVDETNPANNYTPTNASDLFSFLKEQGFFVNSSSGGGSGGAVTFKQLLDVLSPGGFNGKAGNVYIISPDEQYLIPTPLSNVRNIQDLDNWLGGDVLSPDEYLLTSSNANGIITAPLANIVNRPALYDEFENIRKGWVWNGTSYVFNQEQYQNEIGDFFRFMKQNEDGVPVIYEARWKSGSQPDYNLANWQIYREDTVILPNEPGYEQ